MAAKTASLSVNIIADAAKARAGLKEAETAFGKFSREVGNAQGAMGKFRTISGSAFDFVKANAVSFATAAATAIGTFAVKSVMAFQDSALAAKKFADATGLSSEQASRFIEVAGDIGIEAGTVEKAIGFMNKTLGNSPALFKALGVEIAYAADGSRDANGTFINVVDRLNQIKDPAERAATATKLLGRGWMEMAELVGMSADELVQKLGEVSDAKVFDEQEVAKAEALRAKMDELRDKFEDLQLQIGEKLVPVLTDAIDQFLVLSDAIGRIPVLPDLFANWMKGKTFPQALMDSLYATSREIMGLNSEVDLSKTKFDGLRVGLEDVSDQMRDTSIESEALKEWLSRQAEEVDIAKAKWDAFRNGLSIKQQSLSVVQSIEEFRTKWAGATDEAKAKSREYQADLLRNQTAVAGLALQIVGLATTAQNTRIRLLIETGQLEQAWALIQAIQNGMNQLAGRITPDRIERQAGVSPPSGSSGYTAPPPPKAPAPKKTTTTTASTWNYKPAAQYGGPTIATKRYAGLAAGGTLTSSGMVMVGEDGPEMLSLPRGASVIPSIPSKRFGAGQMIVNIQVQAGLVSSPDQVGQEIIEAIKRAERRSGQVFASV